MCLCDRRRQCFKIGDIVLRDVHKHNSDHGYVLKNAGLIDITTDKKTELMSWIGK
ncbi:hypothetical protein CBL_12523 [Carabus blaptoides fortunei]